MSEASQERRSCRRPDEKRMTLEGSRSAPAEKFVDVTQMICKLGDGSSSASAEAKSASIKDTRTQVSRGKFRGNFVPFAAAKSLPNHLM